jgi:hypothetical protein
VARYQNFQSSNNDDVITIQHAPDVEFSSVDKKFFGTPIYWSYDVMQAACGAASLDLLLLEWPGGPMWTLI